MSGLISRLRQPASVTVGADQHAHIDVYVSLARAHVSTRDGCRKGLESEKQMKIWAIDLTEEFYFEAHMLHVTR